MNKIMLFSILFLSLPSYAEKFLSVCQRSPGVRDALVEYVEKSCESITREDLTRLKKVDLADRNLTQISFSDLQYLENLETLYLIDNQIIDIKLGTFSGLKKLQTLSLSGNAISELKPGVFAGLHALRFLALSRNPIHDLNIQVFQDLPSLRQLNMSNTPLHHFPSGLCALAPQLGHIKIKDNPNLKKINDFTFSDCLPILTIDVSGTPLTATRKAAFQGIDAARGLPADFDIDSPNDEWSQP